MCIYFFYHFKLQNLCAVNLTLATCFKPLRCNTSSSFYCSTTNTLRVLYKSILFSWPTCGWVMESILFAPQSSLFIKTYGWFYSTPSLSKLFVFTSYLNTLLFFVSLFLTLFSVTVKNFPSESWIVF